MTKILLVEDDKSLREIYGVRLLAEGYDIVSAGDGEEALAMAIKERPELIVSDVMMPKISGFDMLDILRSTALSSEDQRQRGEQLGADRYLVKSQVGIEDVVRTVHDVLGDIPTAAPNPQQAFGTPAPSAIPRSAPQVAARPAVAPAAPAAAAPTPAPVGPQEPQESSSLPRPTAPFSTPRPSGLGDRIIHPIEDHSGAVDMSSLIEQELSGVADLAPAPTAPAISQEYPSAPAPSPALEPAPAQAAVSMQSPAPAPMPEVAAAPEQNLAPPVQVPPRPAAPNPTSNPIAADPARPFAAPNPAPAATPGGLPMPPEQPPQP